MTLGSVTGEHRDLVHDGFVGQRPELGYDLELRRVPWKGGNGGRGPFGPLPRLGPPQLGHPGDAVGQRQMTGEEDTEPAGPCSPQHLLRAGDDGRSGRQLRDDARLHVVHNEGRPARMARLVERRRDLETEGALHPTFPTPLAAGVLSYGSFTSTAASKRTSSGNGTCTAMKNHSMRPALVSGKSSV